MCSTSDNICVNSSFHNHLMFASTNNLEGKFPEVPLSGKYLAALLHPFIFLGDMNYGQLRFRSTDLIIFW